MESDPATDPPGPPGSGPLAISIGNFDGVHLGHAAIVHTMRRIVGPSGRVMVLAFDPHPAGVLRPGTGPTRLTTASQRERLLRSLGADGVRILVPAPALLAMEPEAFMDDLHRRLRFDLLVEGPDFRFGRGRGGDLTMARTLGGAMGFEVEVVEPVEAVLIDRTIAPVRSTLIRWLIRHGRMEDAGICLGRPYEMECLVVRGDQRGRTIGCPTVNLEHGDRQLPGDGVYAGRALLPDGSTWLAAISVGTKPTFGANARTCEAHLLDWNGALDHYGWTIRLTIEHRLRDQLTFDGLDALLERMARDLLDVRTLGAAAPARA